MAAGPGKYDDIATAARVQARAQAVVLIVLNGARGSGFAVQSEDAAIVASLPKLLRLLADEIEADTTPARN